MCWCDPQKRTPWCDNCHTVRRGLAPVFNDLPDYRACQQPCTQHSQPCVQIAGHTGKCRCNDEALLNLLGVIKGDSTERWIPIENGPPNNGRFVYVTVGVSDTMQRVTEAYYEESKHAWYFQERGTWVAYDYPVTAWMDIPLSPQPYKRPISANDSGTEENQQAMVDVVREAMLGDLLDTVKGDKPDEWARRAAALDWLIGNEYRSLFAAPHPDDPSLGKLYTLSEAVLVEMLQAYVEYIAPTEQPDKISDSNEGPSGTRTFMDAGNDEQRRKTMNRVIRAKIKINSVIVNGHAPRESGVWEKQNEQISAGAVYSEDKTTENYAFSLALPSLSLQMCINNPGAFNHLIEGMEYYLDFIPCEDSK